MEAAIRSVLEEQLTRIQRAFQKHGFVQAGELADRHGALQLTFMKETNGVARLVLMNEAVGTGEDDYRSSVDVVVQSGDSFVRRRVIASRSTVAFENEITGGAIEAAAALAESLKDGDLTDSFALRKEPAISNVDVIAEEGSAAAAERTVRGELHRANGKTVAVINERSVRERLAQQLFALQPDELLALLERLVAYSENILRLDGPKASRYAYTSEEFVGEAFTRALSGDRVCPEGRPLFHCLAGIVRSLISHQPARFEHVTIDADYDESAAVHELPSREDLEAAAMAKELAEQFVKTLDDPELRAYVELRMEESEATAEELAEQFGTTIQRIRSLDRKLAKRRAQWNSRWPNRQQEVTSDMKRKSRQLKPGAGVIEQKHTVHERSQHINEIAAKIQGMTRMEVRGMLHKYGIDPDQTVHRLRSAVVAIMSLPPHSSNSLSG